MHLGMKDKQPLEMMTTTTRVETRRARVAAAGAGAEEGEDLGGAVGSEVEEEALEEDSGVDSAEDSVEVEGEVRMEAEMEVMMEELLEEVSEAVVKVAEEAEDSEEGRVGAVVVKEEAGEVIAVPLKAKAKRKVFSRLAASEPPLSTSPSHFYQKIFTPPVLVAGHHHSSVLSKVLSRVCLFKMSNTCLVTKTASWRQFHVCV